MTDRATGASVSGTRLGGLVFYLRGKAAIPIPNTGMPLPADDAREILHGYNEACVEAADTIERNEKLIGKLVAALNAIRDQEEHEIALDPDWPRRIARAALKAAEAAQ